MKYVGAGILFSLILVQSAYAKSWSDREYALGQTSFFLAAVGPEYSAGVRPLYYYDRIQDQKRAGENTAKLKLDSYKNGKVKGYLGLADYSVGKGNPIQKRWPKASEFLQALQGNPFLKSSLRQFFGKNPQEFLESLKPDDKIVVFAELSLLRPLIANLNSSAFQISEVPKKQKPASKPSKTARTRQSKRYAYR